MISNKEMDRRWALVRSVMATHAIDWIVGGLGHPSGYLRWLTNRTSFIGALAALPMKGPVILASHGDDIHHGPVASYGVEQVVSCAHPNLSVNNQAAAVVDAIRSGTAKRVGVVGLGYFPAAALDDLRDGLPGVELFDASDLIAPLKAVKSAEELDLMGRSARLHEQAIALACETVRPGVTAADVLQKVRAFFFAQGSQTQTLMAGSAPPGTVCKYAYGAKRIMERGDQFAMLIEAGDEDGYYSEAMPTICIGMIPDALQRAFDDVADIQEQVAALLTDGAEPQALVAENNRLMIAKGYPPETRLLGHAQGVDLVERPALSPVGETLRFADNMVVSIHPTTHGPTAWGFPVNQSFLVTTGAPERMLAIKQEIIVV